MVLPLWNTLRLTYKNYLCKNILFCLSCSYSISASPLWTRFSVAWCYPKADSPTVPLTFLLPKKSFNHATSSQQLLPTVCCDFSHSLPQGRMQVAAQWRPWDFWCCLTWAMGLLHWVTAAVWCRQFQLIPSSGLSASSWCSLQPWQVSSKSCLQACRSDSLFWRKTRKKRKSWISLLLVF